MNLMTPDEARRILDGTTPGPWFFDDAVDGRVLKIGPIAPLGYQLDCSTDDAALAAAAPALAAMIAGMREEWGIVTTYLGRHEVEEWGFDTREHAESDARMELNPTRIVRHYVTKPEEIK